MFTHSAIHYAKAHWTAVQAIFWGIMISLLFVRRRPRSGTESGPSMRHAGTGPGQNGSSGFVAAAFFDTWSARLPEPCWKSGRAAGVQNRCQNSSRLATGGLAGLHFLRMVFTFLGVDYKRIYIV